MNTHTSGRHLRAATVAVIIGAVVFGALSLFSGSIPDAQALPPANTPPTLTATGTDPTFTESSPIVYVDLFDAVSATTPESGQGLTTLTLTVSGLQDGNSERLQLGDTTQVTLTDGFSVSSASGVVTANVSESGGTATVTFTFSPALTPAELATFVDGLLFRHNGNAVTDGPRVVMITELTDNGGVDDCGNDTAPLNISSTVTVVATNDDPVLLNEPTDISVTENVASNVDLSASTFLDVDAGSMDITVTLVVDVGTLSGLNANGVEAAGSGTSTLILTSSSAQIDAYLNNPANITYTGPPGTSGDNAATLTLTANDGGNTGAGGGGDVVFSPSINIDIDPGPLTVCVVKILGDNAGEITMPGSARFEVVVNGVALNGQLQPTVDNENCFAPEGAGAASFEVPAGAIFTITEDDTTAGVGPVEISCSVSAIQAQDDRDVTGVLATRSVTVDLDPSENQVECTFVNDTIPVCVSKRFGEAVMDAGMASIEDVEFALDDGAGQVPQDGACNEIPSVEYFVAPGSSFTISETIAAGSPMRPVAISCFQGETQVGSSDLSTASVSIDTNIEQLSTIRCTFTNDVLIVCVQKSALAGAEAVGYSAQDFGFEVNFDGSAAPMFDDQTVAELCDAAENEGDTVVGFAVAPESAVVMVREVDNSANTSLVGPTEIYCDTGNGVVLGDLADGSVAITSGTNVSGVNCFFRNDTLIVCVTKQLGDTALAAGFTASQFGFTVSDGGEIVGSYAVGCNGEDSDSRNSYAYALIPDSSGSVTVTETSTESDAKVGLVSAECFPGLNVSTTDLASRSVVSAKDHGGNSLLSCTFVNDSVAVTIEKTLITDDGATASVGDFLFDAYDSNGVAPSSSPVCPREPSSTSPQAPRSRSVSGLRLGSRRRLRVVT